MHPLIPTPASFAVHAIDRDGLDVRRVVPLGALDAIAAAFHRRGAPMAALDLGRSPSGGRAAAVYARDGLIAEGWSRGERLADPLDVLCASSAPAAVADFGAGRGWVTPWAHLPWWVDVPGERAEDGAPPAGFTPAHDHLLATLAA